MKMRVSLYEVCWNDWCTEAEGFDEYRDQYLARMGVPHAVYVDVTSIVCRRACLSVCLSASERISKTARQIFATFLAHAARPSSDDVGRLSSRMCLATQRLVLLGGLRARQPTTQQPWASCPHAPASVTEQYRSEDNVPDGWKGLAVHERANRRCLITPLDHNSTDTLLVPRPHTAYYKRRRCSGTLCRIIIGGDTMRLSGQQELESDVCCRLQVAPSGESYGGNRRPGRK